MSESLHPRKAAADALPPEPASSIEFSAYSGPLPHPQLLRDFEELHPGTAKRIFDNFFLQAQHRRDLERQVIEADSFSQRFGVIAAAVVGFVGMSGGIWLAHEGRSAQRAERDLRHIGKPRRHLLVPGREIVFAETSHNR